MKRTAIIRSLCVAALSLLCLAALPSCERIFEYEGDCSVNWRMNFRYDLNMKFADAFSHKTRYVTLYAFDQDGTLVWQNSEQGEELSQEGYAMTLDLQPGVYDIIAWAYCDLAKDCFTFHTTKSEGVVKKEDIRCEIIREHDENGKTIVNDHLGTLMHGYIDDLVVTAEEGVHDVRMQMTKNTNDICIVLQNLNGAPMDKDDFTFTITDDNGIMGWDNSLLPCEELTYKSWRKAAGTAGDIVEDPVEQTRTITSASVVLAEMTLGRLMLDKKPRLNITNKAGELIVSIPLVDYALLIKSHYDDMTDQEYLDRQDEFNLTFFLDANMHWISSYIYINSWKVVLSDVDFS